MPLSQDDLTIPALIHDQRESIMQLFGQALDVIEAALGARRVVVRGRQASSMMVDVGPNHAVALATVSSFMRMITVGRFRVKPVPHREGHTLQEWIELALEAEHGRKERESGREPVIPVVPPLSSRYPEAPVLLELIEAHREQIARMFDRAREVFERGLGARRLVVPSRARTSEVEILDVGPDYKIADRAVHLLIQIMIIGRPQALAPQIVPPKRPFQQAAEAMSFRDMENIWGDKNDPEVD